MQSLIQSFVEFGFSASKIKLSTALPYLVAGVLCVGWLPLMMGCGFWLPGFSDQLPIKVSLFPLKLVLLPF